MTKLSVIIVNYNVKFFLEQTLLSVRKACDGIAHEIFVVDNHSADGSAAVIRNKFPEIKLIENKENTGFAKANNQAIKLASGEYILLLNPDTVVEEDTFQKCVSFMDSHSDAGALGVKMVDGKGKFLPESKRAFPSPEVAFYKAFGLSSLFPHSKIFGKYHLGYLNENEMHEVEVLAGAFMFIRKKVLDETGLLDEDFFMYGEDVDLSYRIIKAGYKNYYFPGARIIHYKGESTKKGSLNYVKMFYQAMIIFTRKHISGGSRGSLILFLKIAIYLRALFAIISRTFKNIALPIWDAVSIYLCIWLFISYWLHVVKVEEGTIYPNFYLFGIVPAYILLWIISIYFSGGYDADAKPWRVIRGLLVGTIILAAIYGFLPETLRFSRAIILFGFFAGLVCTMLGRIILHFLKYKNIRLGESGEKRTVIVGQNEEVKRVLSLLQLSRAKLDYLGFVNGISESDSNYLGPLEQLNDICRIYKVQEIIFCSKNISSQQIISWMTGIGAELDYKIVPEDSMSVIGSNSKDLQGELYTIDIRLNIATHSGIRNKRIFDVLAALKFFVLSPVLIFIIKEKTGLFKNIFSVLSGNKTWIGYAPSANQKTLPLIKKGILSPLDEWKTNSFNDATISRLNYLYAKDYTAVKDLMIVWKAMRSLGR
jgi:GT2 family glycosyltransferase